MAENLNNLGVITWIGSAVSGAARWTPWAVAFAILALVYFYATHTFARHCADRRHVRVFLAWPSLRCPANVRGPRPRPHRQPFAPSPLRRLVRLVYGSHA
ncbi:anion permease [Kocuria rhizophila]|nr:anion permease [Kocuria rhizophila]